VEVAVTATSPALRRLFVVATFVTLAVTLLRLAGEMARWSNALFNRDAGGGGALVGIVWLIPVFGVLFGLRLARDGAPPPGAGRAAGFALLALVVNTLLGFGSFALFPRTPVAQLAIFALGSWLAIGIAWRGWPALARVLLAYGLAARVPVVIVMFLAIFGGWDSHYAKPRPDFPAMGPWGLFAWTAVLPQMSIWIYLTVVGGMLFGSAAFALWRRAGGRAPAAVTPAA
jgi:hypothetical protein